MSTTEPTTEELIRTCEEAAESRREAFREMGDLGPSQKERDRVVNNWLMLAKRLRELDQAAKSPDVVRLIPMLDPERDGPRGEVHGQRQAWARGWTAAVERLRGISPAALELEAYASRQSATPPPPPPAPENIRITEGKPLPPRDPESK